MTRRSDDHQDEERRGCDGCPAAAAGRRAFLRDVALAVERNRVLPSFEHVAGGTPIVAICCDDAPARTSRHYASAAHTSIASRAPGTSTRR
jgi:hypothetical protein